MGLLALPNRAGAEELGSRRPAVAAGVASGVAAEVAGSHPSAEHPDTGVAGNHRAPLHHRAVVEVVTDYSCRHPIRLADTLDLSTCPTNLIHGD
mgnify:FL=1